MIVNYDFSPFTLIDHGHRKELGLAMEDYVVLQEIALNSSMDRMDIVDRIFSKTDLSLNRVVIILNRLKALNLLHEVNCKFVVADCYAKTAEKYYKR